MPDAALTVKFGADTQGAIAGIDQVKVRLQSLYAQMDAAKDRQALLINPANIQSAQKQINNIGKEIDALSDNQGFKNLGQSAQGIIRPMNDAYSAIRKIAYILPGVGIGTIFAAAFSVIEQVFGGLEKVNTALKNIKSIGNVLAEALGGQAGDISRVQALAAAVRDSNLTYKERQNALTELKETNKAYFGDLTLEKSSIESLTGKVNDYAQALIRAAVVKGFTDEISKETQEFNKQNDELQKLKLNYDNAQKAAAAFKPVTVVAGGRGGGTGTAQAALEQNKLSSAVTNARIDFEKQRDVVEKYGTSIATLTGKINEAVLSQIKLDPLKELSGSGKGADTLKATEQALNEIIKMEGQLGKSDTRPLFERLAQSIDPAQAELLATKIALVIRNNARDGIKQAITDQEVQLMKEQLSRLLNPDLSSNIDTHIVVRSNIAKEIEKFKEDTGKTLDERLGKNTPAIKTDIKVDPNLIFDEFGRSAAQFSKSVDKISKEFTNILNESLISAIEAVSLNLAGGSLSGLFSDLESIIGQGLESLGKSLLLAFPIIQAAKTAIANAIYDPQLIAIAGVLAIAAGAAIKGLAAKKGIHAFAEGGIVTGPTNALIGEAGPEVIFPLDKLNKFVKNSIGPGSMNINVTGEISGDTLRLLLARSNKNHSYVG